MRGIKASGLTVFFLILICSNPILAREIALITEITGPVTATGPNGKSWNPVLAETLPDGVKVSVGPDGFLKVIHLGKNQELTLKANAEATLTEAGLENAREVEEGIAVEALPTDLTLEAASQQQLGAIDPQRLDAAPPVQAPPEPVGWGEWLFGRHEKKEKQETAKDLGPVQAETQETGGAPPKAPAAEITAARSNFHDDADKAQKFRPLSNDPHTGAGNGQEAGVSRGSSGGGSAGSSDRGSGGDPGQPPAGSAPKPAAAVTTLRLGLPLAMLRGGTPTPPTWWVRLEGGKAGTLQESGPVTVGKLSWVVLMGSLSQGLPDQPVAVEIGFDGGKARHVIPCTGLGSPEAGSVLRALQLEARGCSAQAAGIWLHLLAEHLIGPEIAASHLDRLGARLKR